jgi:4-amino-4-deoxy-L-arabinose transferase-like glycosyltransferase
MEGRVYGMVKRTALWMLALVLLLGAGWGIYSRVILPAGPFFWDEAAHSLKGYLIAHEAREGDWLAFLYDTYRQVYWPPLHSWMTGAAFLICGISKEVARSVSLLAFLVAVLVLYPASLFMKESRSDLRALISGALLLTSPMIIAYSGLVMLETPGILFLCLTLLVFMWLNRREKSAATHLLLGLCLALTYFVRTNYGILLMLAFLIDAILECRLNMKELFGRRNLYTALPPVIFMAVWFAYPPKLVHTFQALVNQPLGVEKSFSLEGLLYYPSALLEISGAPWIFAVYLICLLISLGYAGDRRVRFLIILVVAHFLIGQVHHSKAVRYLFPILPPIYLLTGYVLEEWWEHLLGKRRALSNWIAIFITGGIFLTAGWLYLGALQPKNVDYQDDVSRHLVEALEEMNGGLVIGTEDLKEPPPPVLDWDLVTEGGLMMIYHSGIALNLEDEIRMAETLERTGIPEEVKGRFLKVLRRSDVPGKVRTLYVGHPPHASYSRSPEGLASFLEKMIPKDPPGGIVVITSMEEEAVYPRDYVAEGLRRAGFAKVSEKVFEKTAVRLETYKGP